LELTINFKGDVDMRTIYLFLLICTFSLLVEDAYANRPAGKIAKLTTGLWAEVRDLDPVPSNRDVRHIWLHRGTLLFDVYRPSKLSPYRDAITYFGLPIRILAKKRDGSGWYIENIPNPIKSSFHLTRNVFCPGESNPILLHGDCLNGKPPLGEGFIFNFHSVDDNGDGVPDKKNSQDFFRISAKLDKETATALNVSENFEFDLYERDLDNYEGKGVLFRLDRVYPLHEVRFIESYYQPCGSTKTSEITKEKTLEAYLEAEGSSGFDFWGWLSTSLTIGSSVRATNKDAETISITTTTENGTTFRQWGLIFDYSVSSDDPNHQTPFYVEKVFGCKNNVGKSSFGDRIQGIEIGILDHFSNKNDVYELQRPEDFQRQPLDPRVLDKVDKPVFISVNDSKSQALKLDQIKTKLKIEKYYLAMLVFSQINLSCPESSRSDCSTWTSRHITNP
jgi:hypothetical protein